MNTIEYQKIVGQLLLVGFDGTDSSQIVNAIKQYNFGNIILFKRNVQDTTQLKILCQDIYNACMQYNGIPPFIAIDQEGGTVRRIHDEVTKIPGHMALAAASSYYKTAVWDASHIMATELKNIGINLNLAPVVDINTNPYNPVIGVRAFGDDANIVSNRAREFFVAHQQAGVMACYKHFCGHGSVAQDSHKGLPIVDKTLQELMQVEMIPYMQSPLPDSIMTAHILYQQIDPENCATISTKIITNILRNQLNYQGLVLTDCFEMDALCRTLPIEHAAIQSLNAGCDIITISHTLQKQILVQKSIIQAVQDGTISSNTLQNKLDKIKRYKQTYCTQNSTANPIDRDNNAKIAAQISRASIVVNGTVGDLQNAVVIGIKNKAISTAEDKIDHRDFAQSVGNALQLPYLSVEVDNIDTQIPQVLDFAKGKKVILALSNSHIDDTQFPLYDALITGQNDNILVSMRSPFDHLSRPNPKCHICLFEYTTLSIQSCIEVLQTGKAYGTMPVSMGA